jgi:DNA anti-recombination protein RmuC
MADKAQRFDAQDKASTPTLVPPDTTEPERGRSRLAELGSVLEHGRTRIDQLDAALEKLAGSTLTVTEIGRRVEALRADGRKRLDQLRADALKKMDEAPRTVISAAAGAARNGLRSLSNELHAMAQRLEGAGRKPEAGPGPTPPTA